MSSFDPTARLRDSASMTHLMNPDEVGRALRRIAHQILEQHSGAREVTLVGIKTRGIHLASRLARNIAEFEGIDVPVIELDVTPYRDDHGGAGRVERSEGRVQIDGASVILVDDVLYTGRTVRAAMDALTASGRAARIELAVLVDRGHREVPIRPDYVGKNTPTSTDERVSVQLEETDGQDSVWIVKAH